MQTLLERQAPPSKERQGEWETHISGRFRPITVHQLSMAWWLFKAGHITRRQLRVYFAAHEMHERRRYTKTDTGSSRGVREPHYTLDEIKALVGGRGSKTADAALSADVKVLGRLGLVKIMAHEIEFAVSIDQIRLEDISGFWPFFEQIPNRGRTVPMPRRTCRALAAGFPTAVTAMMIALMIRSLYWHRGEQGGYRVDGRTKCSWIADVFDISRRSVTDARARLIELGWIAPIDCKQWELNKWGQRYRINVETFGPQEQGGSVGESASPATDNPAESASPCLNTSSPSSKEDINTRKPARPRSGPGGGRERKLAPPTLRDITADDLQSTERLLDLHRQAIAQGHPVNGERGRLDFIALAERARAHGHDAPRLFFWLLKQRRFDFITQADEDAAIRRLKQLRNIDPQQRRAEQALAARQETLEKQQIRPFLDSLSDDERFVHACVVVGQQHRVEPFRVASMKGWTRDRWDAAKASYDLAQHRRWAVNVREEQQ